MCQSLTVKEAIEQGYKYCSNETGEYSFHLNKVSAEQVNDHSLVLAEKEPFILTVTPEDIYEDLAENFAINNEVNDDDDKIGDLIREVIYWPAIADKLNEALKKHAFYRPTKIKLIP